jgi:putative endonuclease
VTGTQHLETGRQAEQRALELLEAEGLKLHTRNYCCPQGELDLVMQAPDGALVVVEVRYRHDGSRGTAAETVGQGKRRKLILAAQHLLQSRPELRRKPLRFDVVAVSGAEGADAVEWIQDAFQAG